MEQTGVDANPASTDHRLVPYCVLTDPRLGGVGMTEKEARAKGSKLKVGKVPMADETAGLMQFVVDTTNDRVLGATLLGVEGGEVATPSCSAICPTLV